MPLNEMIPLYSGRNTGSDFAQNYMTLADMVNKRSQNDYLFEQKKQQLEQQNKQKQLELQKIQKQEARANRARSVYDTVVKDYVSKTGSYEPDKIYNNLAQADPDAASFYQENIIKYGNYLAPFKKNLMDVNKIEYDMRKGLLSSLNNTLKDVKTQEEYNAIKWWMSTEGVDKKVGFTLPDKFDPLKTNAMVQSEISYLDKEKNALEKYENQTNRMNAVTQRINAEKLKPADAIKAQELDKSLTVAETERNNLLSAIDELIKEPDYTKSGEYGPGTKLTGMTGANPLRVTGVIPGTPQDVFETKINNIMSKLAVNERSKLKGSGQISDKEQEMLQRSVTILKSGLPRQEFIKELNKLKTNIKELDRIDKQSFNRETKSDTNKKQQSQKQQIKVGNYTIEVE